MSSRPSRISQPSAKLNDPSNEADLPLKSHRDFVEKARAAELEKAHASTVSSSPAPPPQPRSPHAASVEDDHDDEFQPDLEVSNGSEVPTNKHPRAFLDESDHEAGDINSTIPAMAKRPRATSDESDNEAGDITDDIPAKVKGQQKRKKQKTQTGELIFSLFMKPEPNLFCGDKATAGVNVQDIDDDGPQKLNKSRPTADLEHFFDRPGRVKGTTKARAKCRTCA